jgi:glycyl-tRNA synthetase beta subunit
MGFKHDIVDAVLAAQSTNPAGTVRAVKQLSAWVGREDWSSILDGFARCVRILRSQKVDSGQWTMDESKLVDAEEKALFKAVQTTVNRQPSTVDEFLEIVTKLIPSITAFFDKVLVMAEDKAVKENRLGLLQKIASLANGIADLSKLEGF